jgi:preprotein translocase subunit YajC
MTNILFAQESLPSAQSGGLIQTLIMILIGGALFWFMVVNPQRKQQKAAKLMRDTLKKGDKVTAMAIVGQIEKINDDTVIIKTAESTKLEILKVAITEVQSSGSEA